MDATEPRVEQMISTQLHKPFDTVMKCIVDEDPLGMMRLLGFQGEMAVPYDIDLSTIAPQADCLLKVSNPDYFLNVEFWSTYKREALRRLPLYAAIPFSQQGLAVEIVVFLLRPEAKGPEVTGEIVIGRRSVIYYTVVCLWELSPEMILNGPVALLPLLPLIGRSLAEARQLILRMQPRMEDVPARKERWAQTFVLLGLLYTIEESHKLLEGMIMELTDSSTFQAIRQEGILTGWEKGRQEGLDKGLELGLEKGLIEGERRLLIRRGTRRFGSPDAHTLAAIESMSASDQIERLDDRIFEVETWGDLLGN